MTVTTVKARLAELELAHTGVRKAFAEAPPSLQTTSVPAVINFAQGATYLMAPGMDGSSVMVTESRLYLLRYYILPTQQGVVSGEAERACYPFLRSVPTCFIGRQSLKNLAGVQAVEMVSDGGIRVHVIGRDEFVGLEFTLRITEIYSIPLVDY